MMENLGDMIFHPRMIFHFAGFKANGWELQNSGWEFSGYERHSLSDYGRELQIMIHHGGGGLTMVSTVSLLRIEDLLYKGSRQQQDFLFQIMGIQVGDRSYIAQAPRAIDYDFNFSKPQFAPIDMTPSYERIDLSRINLHEFGVFKKLNDSANLFLPEKTVNELMDEILKKHEPLQKEIRKNRKRESFMQEFNRNPNENIKLQLVAV